MDFLLKYNITNEEIDDIIANNDRNIINNIILNKKNVVEVIEYLKDLGVNRDSLKDLFMYQIGFFYRSKKEIVDAFEEYEIDSIVKSLNYDVNTVDLIEF